MNVRCIDETDMSPPTDAAIRQLLCRVFPADVPVYTHTRAWHDSHPAYSVILEEEGDIIAHAGVVDRLITVGDRRLRAAGVQNVFVVPERRGRGLSSQVVPAAMQEAAGRGFDLGVLFCKPGLERLYGAMGWLPLRERDIIRVEAGRDLPLPDTILAMYLPLAASSLPDGAIHLAGNDW